MNLETLIQRAAELPASDIHLVYGLPPMCRVLGQLVPLEGEPPLTDEDCAAYACGLCGMEFPVCGEWDGAATIAGRRIRINLFRQQGHISASLRLLADSIPELSGLGLPPKVEELTQLRRGIVLVTGETGSGKSTTLAAMIERINQTRTEHIITLEDPIEYLYTPKRCVFNQREVGQDTQSFADGLRAALREDPDILLLGEMRDLDTISTALTAAETGHLVLGTLHTASAADAIDRMVDVFPADRQRQIRVQLAQTLQAVLSQQLLPRADRAGRVAACELMVVNTAIRNLILEGKSNQIANSILTSGSEGAVTMDNALIRLFKAGRISAQTAREAAHDLSYLGRYIQ